MRSIHIRKLFLTAAIALFAAVFSFGQPAGLPNFNRSSTFDAQHYTLRVSFDRSAKSVLGDTTVVLKPLAEGFREFELDAVGLAFQSVTLDPGGAELKYTVRADTIRVILDRSYGPMDTISVRFKYSATPKKGVYFVDAVDDPNRVNHSAQIWTQGEPEEARHWFPSFDFPSDKATTEALITAESGETVIGNGEFLGKTDNGNGTTTWHLKMPVPHSTYLVSFVIGKYVRLDDTMGEIPLGYYVYPGKETTGRNAFTQTKEMIPIFEQITRVKFPFNKYDQTIVASFQFGGMENITATTMSDNEIFFGDFDFGKPIVTDLVSHELAHSWFGNLVTCRNWAELWLNEGFATYMEAVYREARIGREDYIKKVKSDAATFIGDDAVTKRRHGLFNQRAGEVDKLFDNASVTYNKGGVVLHMLREEIGNAAFWKAVTLYLNRHKFGSVETVDLQKAMEETSGQKLDWFFDQWVYKAGVPKITVSGVYSSSTKLLRLTVTQLQKTDRLVPAAFRLPIDVVLKMDRASQTTPIIVTARTETFSLKSMARPLSIEIDPLSKVPAMDVKVLPIRYVRK